MKTKQPKSQKRKPAGQPRGLSVTAGSASVAVKTPKCIWADFDPKASRTVRWAFYRTKAEQRENRPDLQPIRLRVFVDDSTACEGCGEPSMTVDDDGISLCAACAAACDDEALPNA